MRICKKEEGGIRKICSGAWSVNLSYLTEDSGGGSPEQSRGVSLLEEDRGEGSDGMAGHDDVVTMRTDKQSK
jgi:hypothetical protein